MEYNFEHYLALPIVVMGRSNFISIMDLTNGVKLGLYYLMDIYGLGCHHSVHGTWEWISLSQGEEGKILTGDEIKEIIDKAFDTDSLEEKEKYLKHKSDFENGIFPDGFKTDDEELPNFEPDADFGGEVGEFGWLSPTGKFIVSDWGEHENSALDIIENNEWNAEYRKWKKSLDFATGGDYLCQVKGYVLIHNPSMDGGYVVTQVKPLTKKQREFLYDYFYALGNKLRANHYLEGE